MKFIIYFVFAVFISVAFLIIVTLTKKKDNFKDDVTFKSYVAPGCFFAAGVIGFVSNAFQTLSAPIWWLIVVFMMIGTYFMKFLPKPKE